MTKVEWIARQKQRYAYAGNTLMIPMVAVNFTAVVQTKLSEVGINVPLAGLFAVAIVAVWIMGLVLDRTGFLSADLGRVYSLMHKGKEDLDASKTKDI